MSTGTPVIANEIELLREQAKIVHRVLRMNAEGLTQQDSLIQPQPGGNCLNWVVGHLVCVYGDVLPVLGQEPVFEKEALKRYDRGSAQLEEPGEALPLEELLGAWDEASRRVDRGLAGASTELLDQRAPFSPRKNPDETVRSLLTVVMFHQAYHAGQSGLLRRLAGKEGAMK